uniref:ParA family protein n=1 Tax=Salmonella sp. 14 TaxID=1179812 RepID=I3W3G9_9ENTR|nr:hypothetical protein [Salmonella sp. 14]
MGIIANAHPKGGAGKTTSSVNLVGEMKTDAVDLDTHWAFNHPGVTSR